jgi:hypothetical protein
MLRLVAERSPPRQPGGVERSPPRAISTADDLDRGGARGHARGRDVGGQDDRVAVEDLVRRHGEWHKDEEGHRMLRRRGVIRIARTIRRAERRELLIVPQDA